jgi:hypothetical protein
MLLLARRLLDKGLGVVPGMRKEVQPEEGETRWELTFT